VGPRCPWSTSWTCTRCGSPSRWLVESWSSAQPPYLARQLSVQKVVPTLTSKSAEIYLSMAGAKQLMTQGLSWFRPGSYVQQWCARGTILCCTMVLAEGSYKWGGKGGWAPGPWGVFEASANIVVKAVSVRVCALCPPPAARGLPPPFVDQGG
jgi:hypothetical protein